MVRVAVVGASGYTGVELLRLLANHPDVVVSCVTSEQSAGKRVSETFPSLRGRCDLVLQNAKPQRVAEQADFIFTALPHKAAMQVIPLFLEAGLPVVDLSADYRLRDAEAYGHWYEPHLNPQLLAEAVYGLPELHRSQVARARLVANPGCYPTSVILGLLPLLREGLVEHRSIIVDAKSGVSGAGRAAKVDSLFCEVNDGFKAYGVGGVHRHIPEIEQELSLLAQEQVTISFTPHLVPMDRGILSTIYATCGKELDRATLLELYQQTFAAEPFVRVLTDGSFPSTLQVRGANFCDIGLTVDRRTGRVIVVSAIDNLVKGAAGQAIQNMNLMLGFTETTGLTALPLYP
jgi:N-acetyl-gamma-glutamyl-phosphate reductase